MMVLEDVAIEEQEGEELDGSLRGEELPTETEIIRIPASRGLSLNQEYFCTTRFSLSTVCQFSRQAEPAGRSLPFYLSLFAFEQTMLHVL